MAGVIFIWLPQDTWGVFSAHLRLHISWSMPICKYCYWLTCQELLLFSCQVTSDSLPPYRLQHARLPCPSLSPEFAQTRLHWVCDAIQLFHPLSPPYSPALNLSQHQGLFQRVGSLHQMDKSALLKLHCHKINILKVNSAHHCCPRCRHQPVCGWMGDSKKEAP